MRFSITITILFFYTSTLLAQKFTMFSDEKRFCISSDAASFRQNCIQSEGKIYYEVHDYGYTSSSVSDANLAVVDNDGKNVKIFFDSKLRDAAFLAATDKYIYFTTSRENKNKPEFMYLHRLHKSNGQVEIIKNTTNNIQTYDYGFNLYHPETRMYAYKNKLVFIGRNNMGQRFLAVVLDSLPIAYPLSVVAGKYDYYDSRNSFETPAADDIAITDSLVYMYVKTNNPKVNGVRAFLIKDTIHNQQKLMSIFFDFESKGFTGKGYKLVVANGKCYTLLRKNQPEPGSPSYYLYEFTGINLKQVGSFTADLENPFMKVFGDDIYFGGKSALYKYNAFSKKITLLYNTVYNISLLQNQEYILQGSDGTIFMAVNPVPLSTKGVFKDNREWKQTIIAIDKNNSVDTVCVIAINEEIGTRKIETYDKNPFYIIGNSLYRIGIDNTTKTSFLEKYSKENNWKTLQIDFPSLEKSRKKDLPEVGNGGFDAWQLNDALLIRRSYYTSKEKLKTAMYIFTEK